MFDVVITQSAELDIQENYRWWYDIFDRIEQAIRWFCSLYNSIENLRDVPDRCPFASEAESLENANPPTELWFGEVAFSSCYLCNCRSASRGLARSSRVAIRPYKN